MDVLFLAFANSQNNPLPSLSQEDDKVFSILVNRALKGQFFVHRDSYSTVEKINDYLGRYQDRLALFLYSGHAGGDAILLGEEEATAKGIAYQLGESARKNKLKLVILNGCSTAGQVKGLLDVGVPVVVATSAPINDKSATAFSIRLFQCLVEKRMTIRQAYEEALGPAQTAANFDLSEKIVNRDLVLDDNSNKSEPIWGLFSNHPESFDTNPIPTRMSGGNKSNFEPNEKLTEALFKTLLDAGNRDIRNLHEKEEDGDYVEIGDKQTAIVNILPFPVAVHLQKLLCPIELENEGFDKVSLRRLEQIATVFHMTTELMSFIMVAQLWELKLMDMAKEMPGNLVDILRKFFHLSPQERAGFDNIQFIRSIRQYLDTLPTVKDSIYFVEELKRLKDISTKGHSFEVACEYLAHLRLQTIDKNISAQDVSDMCAEAENSLCDFLSELGFLHRYTLTSIQNIDIHKYRHQLTPTFSHEAVKLMRAFGKPEQNYYLLPRFLDNRGVTLIKGKVKVLNPQKRQFTGDNLEFLNLSPFIIDRNAFEENTDLSNLMFFDHFRPGASSYSFRSVKRPGNLNDRTEANTENQFEAVHLQLEAFRSMILNEETD